MLVSEQKERTRKFKLALRAGLPIFILIGLVAYGTFFQIEALHFGLKELVLTAALIFVTTYFIFFLLQEDGQNTLIDPITNSYNYPAFLKHFKSRRPGTLALLVVDNLGIVNENYGTEDINSMLRSLVYQLDATLSAFGITRAIIGRKQGAEFILGADANERQLREAIESFIADHPSILDIELDYRFGTLNHPEGDLEKIVWHLHDLIRAEGPAKTSAEIKSKQKNNEKDLNELEKRIVEALHSSHIVFALRPLFHIKTQAIDAYEVAAKLQLDDGEAVLPRVYLPIINRLGLGRDYDFALLTHVLALLPLLDPGIAFSFNLSPFSLRNSDFQRRAFDLIAQSGIDPSRLIIELYERKTHHNLEGYLKTLGTFRARGIRICIDNFGSSNASMEYIRHFKFDMVQFDRDFVSKLDDRNTHAMLRSLVEMSRSLGITTVAKWVDKPEQKEKLIAMGIDYLQGFGIAKALSESDLITQHNPQGGNR